MGTLTKDDAKKIPIVDLARSLGMDLRRSSPSEYYWTEHDSLKLNVRKNTWRRYSTGDGGDTIALVRYIKDISYRQAMDFLEKGEYEASYTPLEELEDFHYSLEPYEKPFKEARDYLRTTRSLSDDTIDFFYQKGVLAQATKRAKDSYEEDVLVFKFYDRKGELVGASLQGLSPNKERYEAKGYLKQIVFASQGIAGMSVDIGQPKRLVFAEAPIDLMSYYETHKEALHDVRLVSMDGLKDGVVSRYAKELLQEMGLVREDNLDLSKMANVTRTATFLENAAKATRFLQEEAPQDLITLAVDNDKAGRDFIEKCQDKNIPVLADLPALTEGKDKMDWNDWLKSKKGETMTESYRLRQARASLEREKQRVDEQIEKAYAHQRQTNGQPMNDKRGGAAFFKRQQQIEDQISRGLDRLAQKEERVERLEHQERLKQEGFNKTGSGLDMSVHNIARIREEIEKANRGESFFSKATIRKYKAEVERLEGIKELSESVVLTAGAEALLASGQLNQWQKQPNIYFIKGQRGLALTLSEEGNFVASTGKYYAKTPEQAALVKEILATQEAVNQEQGLTSSLEPQLKVLFDFSENPKVAEKYRSGDVIPYQEFVSDLYSENNRLAFGLGYDKTYFSLQNEQGDTLIGECRYDIGSERELISEALVSDLPAPYLALAQESDLIATTIDQEQEKSPEQEVQGQEKNAEGTIGDFPEEQGAAPLPEANVSQPLNDLSPSQTQPQPLLYFTTKTGAESIEKRHYHLASSKDIAKLNRYASIIQQTAQWYLNELADSQIVYFYQDGDTISSLSVQFDRDKFMHLTGIFPYREGQTAEQTLLDFANGKGDFDTILVADRGAAFDKIKVLPELETIIDSDSFYFGDLSEVPKLHQLNLDKAIKSGDDDIVLALRTVDGTPFPASLMKLRQSLKLQLEHSNQERTILGVYRYRNEAFEQLSINENYVKDGGAEMLSILQNRQYEEVQAKDDDKVLESNSQGYLNNYSHYQDLSPEEAARIHQALEHPVLNHATDTIDYLLSWSVDADELEQLIERFKDDTELPITLTKAQYALTAIREQAGLERDAAGYSQGNQTVPTKTQEMTDLLDSIYNLGVGYFVNERPRYNATDLKDRLDLFFERYEAMGKDLSKTIDSFIEEGAVNLDSSFYEDWQKDKSAVKENGLDTSKEEVMEEKVSEAKVISNENTTVKTNQSIMALLDKKDDKGLSKLLEDGISEFRNSDKYKAFLLTMSKFHRYSFRNIQLLLAQNPDVTRVASFNKWKKDFGRYVNKGEKSLKVFAPIQITKRDRKGEPVLDERGDPIVYTAYKLVPVFDVSQTNGKDLPRYINELKGTPEGYNNLYRALRDVSETNKVSISFVDNLEKANGYYNLNENAIVIKKGMSKAQTLKTLIHEVAHSDLHNKDRLREQPILSSHAELQAESVAYVVSAYYGFDTSDYSMPYLNAWLMDKVELSDLKAQLDTVQKEAKDLITRIDKCLGKYQEKEVVQDKLTEKINALEKEEAKELDGVSHEKKQESSQTRIP